MEMRNHQAETAPSGTRRLRAGDTILSRHDEQRRLRANDVTLEGMSPTREETPSAALTDRVRLQLRAFVRAVGEFWEGYLKSPHGC